MHTARNVNVRDITKMNLRPPVSVASPQLAVGLSPNLYAVQANKRVLSEENIEFKRSVFSALSSEFLQKLQLH